ncbi:MAG: hypothetical protein P1P88_25440, partial [Bacteroidales bacterium]|nr:hypothetical protein [Bacteroidales bacterium]
EINSKANQTVVVKGNLTQGALMDDLSWAWKSSVACFPGTQKNKFTGNHVLYFTQLPGKAIMNIVLTPDDKNSNFSLYAYSIGTNNFSTVPDLHSCVSCEADHKWDYPKKGKTQDHKRMVSLNAINNPYQVVIGVVGADGLRAGGYSLSVQLEGGEEVKLSDQEPVNPISVACEKNKTTEVRGNLENGVLIHDLSWAWKSSVACFPETQKKKFTGKHVVYVTEVPKYSTMEITVEPDDKNSNFSLYAYEIGLTNNSIVPNLNSCIRCEAEHKWDYPKKNRTQDHTRTVSDIVAMNQPYKVVIDVTGADGLSAGGYTIRIRVVSKN